MLIVENVDVNPATDGKWLAKKKFFGVTLPADEIELKLFYVKEHLVFNEEDGGDFNKLPLAIMQLSGISQRAVAAGKATFRNTLRQRRGKNARPTAAEANESAMVDEQPVQEMKTAKAWHLTPNEWDARGESDRAQMMAFEDAYGRMTAYEEQVQEEKSRNTGAPRGGRRRR